MSSVNSTNTSSTASNTCETNPAFSQKEYPAFLQKRTELTAQEIFNKLHRAQQVPRSQQATRSAQTKPTAPPPNKSINISWITLQIRNAILNKEIKKAEEIVQRCNKPILCTKQKHLIALGMIALHGDAQTSNKDIQAILILIVKFGVNINQPLLLLGTKNAYVLLCAVRSGRKDIVTFLLNRGASINVKDGCHKTSALHIAAYQGNIAMIQLLLSRGADPCAQLDTNETPFKIAARHDHISALPHFLNQPGSPRDKAGKERTRSQSYVNETPQSILNQSAAQFTRLPSYKNLKRAVISGDLQKVLLYLKRVYKGDKRDKEFSKNVLLHLAVRHGHYDITEHLIQIVTDINTLPSASYDHILIAAIKKQYYKIAFLLINSGADINTLTWNRDSILHLLAKTEAEEGAKAEAKAAVVKLLLSKGADPTLLNGESKTPLQCCQDKEILRLFKGKRRAESPLNSSSPKRQRKH